MVDFMLLKKGDYKKALPFALILKSSFWLTPDRYQKVSIIAKRLLLTNSDMHSKG